VFWELVYIYIHIYMFYLSLFLSLSLSLYIYIYVALSLTLSVSLYVYTGNKSCEVGGSCGVPSEIHYSCSILQKQIEASWVPDLPNGGLQILPGLWVAPFIFVRVCPRAFTYMLQAYQGGAPKNKKSPKNRLRRFAPSFFFFSFQKRRTVSQN
jgi:hypothetical protein